MRRSIPAYKCGLLVLEFVHAIVAIEVAPLTIDFDISSASFEFDNLVLQEKEQVTVPFLFVALSFSKNRRNELVQKRRAVGFRIL